MNFEQKLILDQYIEWLFKGDTNEVYTALEGLKVIALPEAIPHILNYIEHIGNNWIEWEWSWSRLEDQTNKAREVLDAIYIKAGQEALQDEEPLKEDGWQDGFANVGSLPPMPDPSEDPDLSGAS